MIKILLAFAFLILSLTSCNQKPSLEKYFVTSAEDKSFVQIDINPSILNVNKTQLTKEQQTALSSFDKMNVLAFKINDKNKAQFETERIKVKEILKDQKYQQLMKFGSGKEGASVSFVGEDEHISEIILFGNKSDSGFAIVRILGKDMNPSAIVSMLSILKSTNIDLEQLKPLQDLMK